MSLNAMARAAAASAVPGGPPLPPDPKTSALTKYIPTESVTLYVALAVNQATLHSVWSGFTPAALYWGVLALTPLFVLALFVNKLPEGTTLASVGLKGFPWWPLVAGCIAYLAWALSVPGNPVLDTAKEAHAVFGGLTAVLCSTVLAAVETLAKKVF